MEKADETLVREESDFVDLELPDFDISADEFGDEYHEKKATSLLNIVTNNIDKDCSDISDWEEDNNIANDHKGNGKKVAIPNDDVDIASSDVEKKNSNVAHQSSLGGYVLTKFKKPYLINNFRFLKNMHGMFEGLTK